MPLEELELLTVKKPLSGELSNNYIMNDGNDDNGGSKKQAIVAEKGYTQFAAGIQLSKIKLMLIIKIMTMAVVVAVCRHCRIPCRSRSLC